ncbi:MAG: flagellar basal body rod protein FlgB [Gammaproteobacteria bacterium]|nr:MAG: flagellar basal body rod protein FlgB [Gammaproteobacteria bacterium]
MPIDFDSALGPLPQALALRAQRMELLAGNLANADTPGYKARDIDFRAAMAEARRQTGIRLATTRPGHLGGGDRQGITPPVRYRVPDSPSLDGNTVDSQREQAAFAENAIQYQATLTFLNGRIDTLRKAIRGE